jgi:hypothetical protein
LLNGVSIKIFILGLRWIIRDVYIYLIIKFSFFSSKDKQNIINIVLIIGFFESILGFSQIFFREKLAVILSPKALEIGDSVIEITQATSKFAIYGTLGRYSEFGLFIGIVMIVLMGVMFTSENKNINHKSLFLIYSAALIFSYARQATLCVIIIGIFMVYRLNNKKINRIKIILTLAIVILTILTFISIDDLQNVTTASISQGIFDRYLGIFTQKYWQDSYNSKGRVYFFISVLAIFFKTKPMLGYGVGMFGTRTALLYDTSVYNNLNIPTMFSMDVYWVSIIGQIGIIGLIFLVGVYLIACKKSYFKFIKKQNIIEKRISLITYMIIILGFLVSFFGASFSNRYLAFYVWLFIGLSANKSVIYPNKINLGFCKILK